MRDFPGCVACSDDERCFVHRHAMGEKCEPCQGRGWIWALDENKLATGEKTICDHCAGVGLVDKSLPRTRKAGQKALQGELPVE